MRSAATGAQGALVVPAFGLAMGLAFVVTWLVVDRPFTARASFAAVAITVAAMLAASVALAAMRILARRPWSARFAAALLLLSVGTVGLTCLFAAAHTAWLTHPLAELPLHHVLAIVAITGAGTLYGFLANPAHLLLPLGLPLILLFARVIARQPR